MTRLETRDLYEGAWYLAKGATVDSVHAQANGCGRPKVTFILEGIDLEELRDAYRDGRAMAEVTRLRVAMNHLRDVLFDALRASGSRG